MAGAPVKHAKPPLGARLRSCIAERRIPYTSWRPRRRTKKALHRLECLSGHYLSAVNPAYRHRLLDGSPRCLYASAVNADGKPWLEKIIRQVDVQNVDFLVFCYDDTDFDEAVFDGIKLIRERGFKWEFMRKYLTPEYCREYDYVLPWDDDIDPLQFSLARLIDIMQRNRLEQAQPGISPDSNVNLDITRARSGITGRFTDFVENMVPVFTRRAWTRYWSTLEAGRSFWGWQHAATSRSACRYRRMGIIDREPVAHLRPLQSRQTSAPDEARSYFKRHPGVKRASMITLAYMR